MKENKTILSIILFIIGFIITYLMMCYCVPGLRIKLAAEPMEYFIKSIKNATLLKTIISSIVATILAILPHLIKNK